MATPIATVIRALASDCALTDGWEAAAPDCRFAAEVIEGLLSAAVWAESALAPFSKEPAEKSGITLLRAAIAKARTEVADFPKTTGEA